MKKLVIFLLLIITASCGRKIYSQNIDIVFTAYNNNMNGVYGMNTLTSKIYPVYVRQNGVIPMSVSFNLLHNMILFISNDELHYNIYLKDISAGGILHKLTHGTTNYGSPAFCFNRKIVYITYISNNLPQIYLMNIDGSFPGLLISDSSGATTPICGDNSKIAYVGDPFGNKILKLYDIKTGNVITTGVNGVSSKPAFSPYGQKLVYSKLNNTGYQSLYILDLTTMTSRVLLSQNYNAYEPTWGANNKIAFTCTKDKATAPHIYEINPDGTGLKLLINYGSADGDPSW